MRIVIPLVVSCILLLTSCARILNSRYTDIKITADSAMTLVIKNDTIALRPSATVTVLRSADFLKFETIHQDSSYQHQFKALNSLAYYLNINPYAGYGLGLLVDAKSSKRYTYPQKIWIKNNRALDYHHKNPNFKFDNTIKIALNNMLDFNDFLEPSVYYERRLNSFSSSTIGFGVPVNNLGRTKNLKGYRLGYEHRFYFKQTAPLAPYIGLEFSYFTANYLSNIRFINESIHRETDPFGLTLLLGAIFDIDERSYREWVKLAKKTYTFNVKYGVQQKINRFIVDFSVGLGMKNREVKHLDRFRPEDEIYRSWFDIFNSRKENEEGNSWSLTVPLSLKFGYSF
jgi:hypothetical protein